MKKAFLNFKKTIIKSGLVIASIAMVLSYASCSESKKDDDKKDPKEVAEDKNDEKIDSTSNSTNTDKMKWDADFLVAAAEINQEEIQLGQLAQTNGQMKEVKDLGKMLVADHSKASAELKALAAKKSIALPASLTDDAKDAYKKLSEKKGKDFDNAYTNMMVDGHKKAIEKFEKAAADATNPEIKAWAASMLPGLKTHLDHAITCQKNHEKM